MYRRPLAASGWELHSFTVTLSDATTPVHERYTFVFTRKNATFERAFVVIIDHFLLTDLNHLQSRRDVTELTASFVDLRDAFGFKGVSAKSGSK